MSSDIFIPQSSASGALLGPLSVVTYVTSDKNAIETMFCQGMSLETEGWSLPSGDSLVELNAYYGFDAGDTWEVANFYRSGRIENISIRVICLHRDTPRIRPAIDGRYFGGATVGFPMSDMPARERQMADAGFESSVGVKELVFSNPQGEEYVSREIHFLGVENVFVLGVQRPDVFVQIGEIDASTNIGAAAYSCRCVEDLDRVSTFLNDVLAYEIRRDMTMEVGPRSGLRLKEGMPERFAQAFAPGSGTGYLVFLEHGGFGIPSPAPSIGAPNRGLVMWSFETDDLAQVHQRAEAFGAHMPQAIKQRSLPVLGEVNSLIIEDPEGFSIEVYQKLSSVE